MGKKKDASHPGLHHVIELKNCPPALCPCFWNMEIMEIAQMVEELGNKYHVMRCKELKQLSLLKRSSRSGLTVMYRILHMKERNHRGSFSVFRWQQNKSWKLRLFKFDLEIRLSFLSVIIIKLWNSTRGDGDHCLDSLRQDFKASL